VVGWADFDRFVCEDPRYVGLAFRDPGVRRRRFEDAVTVAEALDDVYSSSAQAILAAREPGDVLSLVGGFPLVARKEGHFDDPRAAQLRDAYGFQDLAGRRGARVAARTMTCLAADYLWMPYAHGVLNARAGDTSSLRTDLWAASAAISSWATVDHPAVAVALGAALSVPGSDPRPFPPFEELLTLVAEPFILGPPGPFRTRAGIEPLQRCAREAASAVTLCLLESLGGGDIGRGRITDRVIRAFASAFPVRDDSPRLTLAGYESSTASALERDAAGGLLHTIQELARADSGASGATRARAGARAVPKAAPPPAPKKAGGELETAIDRGALARVRVLRKERETWRAWRLWSSVDRTKSSAPSPDPSPETRPGFLAVQKRIEYVRLLLRMNDEKRYGEALDEMRDLRKELERRDTQWARPTERRLRLLAELADALTVAGDDDTATAVTGFALSRNPKALTDLKAYREVIERDSRGRVVDLVQKHATRLSRLAYLFALSDDAADARAADEYLESAHAAATAALEVVTGAYATLSARATLARVDIERATLTTDPEERRQALAAAAAKALRVWMDSDAAPEVGPDRLTVREGHFGAALASLAFAADDKARELAGAAVTFLYPQIRRYQGDSNDDPARSIRYADACAMCGQHDQALVAWQRVHARFMRIDSQGHRATAVARRALEARIHGRAP
jgi:hypothetical protein